MRKLLIGAFGAAVLAAAPAMAETYNLTLAGASPGGLWSTIGAGIDKAIAKAYPGSTVTYQTGSGGLANAKLVQDKKVPFGIIGDPELSAAVNGTGPFKGRPQKDLRVLFRVYSPDARFQMVHVLLNGDIAKRHGIKTMADLKKQAGNIRVAFNRPGNMDGDIGIATVEAHGIAPKSFKQVVRAASREQVSLMLDRRIDLQVYGIAYRHPRVREVANGIPLTMLNIGQAASEKLAAQFGGKVCMVKAKEYKFLDADSTSVCLGAIIGAHKDMDDKTAYNIVKGVLKNIEDFKTAHRLLKKVTTPKSLAEPSVAPHHPGAIKAFKEAGLM
ncbi:MAG: TAXI family TRAP transporter solute-binding subunit [Alphaproteobacteria bacterium]|nr:TAXI family TRAP transporter solute-binding subunit [Alphaproteobacteria bacterium]